MSKYAKLSASIIIPVYNDIQRLEKCIKALKKQTLPSSRYEIIVVDNNSIENISDLALKYGCKYLFCYKQGSYAARNKGVEYACGRYLGFTDADCIPDSQWVENAVRELSNRDGLVVLGGDIRMFFENSKPTSLEWYEYYYAFNQKTNIKHRKYAVTANLWASREIFEKCGAFNEELISGGDLEWGKRLHQKGYRISYTAECKVYHPCRASLKQVYRKIYRVQTGQLELHHHEDITLHARPFSLKTILRTSRPPVRQIAKWFFSSELPRSVALKLSWASVLIAGMYSIVIVNLLPQIIAYNKGISPKR